MANCRQQFSCAAFTLSHDTPTDLSSCKWQRNKYKVSPAYLLYRGIIFLMCFAFLSSYATDSDTRYFFIYLTNLGFMGLNFHLLMSFVVLVEKLILERQGNFTGSMTLIAKLSWITHNVMTLLSIVITVIYWVALYDPEEGLTARDFFVHGFNSIVTISDIFISARPCRLLHFYHPGIALLLYVIFSVIYWVAGGINEDGYHYIYPILDWDKPEFTGPFVAVGFVVALPVLQAFIFGLHCLRDWIFKKLRKNEKIVRSAGIDNLALENI